MPGTVDSNSPPEIQIAPLTPARWADLESVFGDGRGVCGHAAAVPGARRGRPAARAAGLSGRGSGRLGPGRSARRRAGLEQRASPHGADRRGSSRRPAGVGHLLLRDQGGLPPTRDRDGASRRRARLGPRERRVGARGLPGRGERHPTTGLALSRARVDVPPRWLSRSRMASPRPAADAPRAQRPGYGLQTRTSRRSRPGTADKRARNSAR
jgi:hypothetical protein